MKRCKYSTSTYKLRGSDGLLYGAIVIYHDKHVAYVVDSEALLFPCRQWTIDQTRKHVTVVIVLVCVYTHLMVAFCSLMKHWATPVLLIKQYVSRCTYTHMHDTVHVITSNMASIHPLNFIYFCTVLLYYAEFNRKWTSDTMVCPVVSVHCT